MKSDWVEDDSLLPPRFEINVPHIIRGLIRKKTEDGEFVLDYLEEERMESIAKGFHEAIMSLEWDITSNTVVSRKTDKGIVLEVSYIKHLQGAPPKEDSEGIKALEHDSPEAKFIIGKIILPLLREVGVMEEDGVYFLGLEYSEENEMLQA